jgi:hypothetical protein
MLVGSCSVIIRDSELIHSCEMCCVPELKGHGQTYGNGVLRVAGRCKDRILGPKQRKRRGLLTGLRLRTLLPRRNAGGDSPAAAALCAPNQRRLTGKALHGTHFPMEFFTFS